MYRKKQNIGLEAVLSLQQAARQNPGQEKYEIMIPAEKIALESEGKSKPFATEFQPEQYGYQFLKTADGVRVVFRPCGELKGTGNGLHLKFFTPKWRVHKGESFRSFTKESSVTARSFRNDFWMEQQGTELFQVAYHQFVALTNAMIMLKQKTGTASEHKLFPMSFLEENLAKIAAEVKRIIDTETEVYELQVFFPAYSKMTSWGTISRNFSSPVFLKADNLPDKMEKFLHEQQVETIFPPGNIPFSGYQSETVTRGGAVHLRPLQALLKKYMSEIKEQAVSAPFSEDDRFHIYVPEGTAHPENILLGLTDPMTREVTFDWGDIPAGAVKNAASILMHIQYQVSDRPVCFVCCRENEQF